MKTILCFFLIVTWFVCQPTANKNDILQKYNATNPERETVNRTTCLAQTDAEKILGQTAKMTESSSESTEGITKFRCTYTADAMDPETSKTGNIYYLLEEYVNVDFSKKSYSDILKQNQNMSGLKELNEIGDQAFMHTDNENFLLIISRKGNKIVRLKVNKLTSRTSSQELWHISKAITAEM